MAIHGTSDFWQETEDWHTAGEPFRIVRHLPAESLIPDLPVAEQRLRILKTLEHPLDRLRQALCHEPRGHADMYGGFITPPDDANAHFGVLFWHKDGFSTACGHGTIALGYWAISHGLVDIATAVEGVGQEGTVDVVVDAPSGRVVARATIANAVDDDDNVSKKHEVDKCDDEESVARRRRQRIVHVDFVNVASYQISRQVPVPVETSNGRVAQLSVDISFGGAVYVFVDTTALGLRVEPKHCHQFVRLQRQIRARLAKFVHQDRYEIYGVCFYQHIDDRVIAGGDVIEQRNVVVFADGQIDRSPCGSGTAARIAILYAQKRLTEGKKLIHHSILNTTFEADVVDTAESPTPFPACVPRIRGNAHLVGRHNFYINPADPIYPGFVFR